ncbi:integumentary mucin C.1-like [Haliotis rubra]|uniref:integumentary mucin C.1-like n=1 Tax=Haliotis rubra TaxID=36100 RepID=UPI001EE57D0F|nr:integumentary mucin C.1-like [Haliotis rubra]
MELLCEAIGCLVVCISTCGTHAASYTARYFTYSTTAVSWNTAYTTCSLARGHLITVDNKVIINVLKYIRAQPEAAAVSRMIWMGLYNAAPTSDVPVYIWDDCKHLDDSNSMWRRGEPNFVQTHRCIITSPGYKWKTRPCTQTHSFFCESVANVDCTFEKELGQKCEMGGVLLSKTMAEDACATRCQEDMDGKDVCWAYEYNNIFRQCNLLFGSDPYMCETLQENRMFITGRRRCFKFADITGSEVTGPADSFPNCSITEVTTTETPAVTPTTSMIGTTVETITSTSATTSTTPDTTVMISTTLETTTTTIPTTAISTSDSAVTSSVTPTVTTTSTTTTTTPTIPTTTTSTSDSAVTSSVTPTVTTTTSTASSPTAEVTPTITTTATKRH